MAPPKTVDVNDKVDLVSKEVEEMRGAIRSLATACDQNVGMIAKLRDEISNLRAEVERLKNVKVTTSSVSNYGASINKYQ